MTELKQAPLMENRSYGAVLKAAYNLLTDNFKKTFKHIWAYALVLSCLLALFFICSLSTTNLYTALLAAATSPLLLIAEILFYARALMPLNGQSMKWNSLRVLKLYIALFVAFTIVCLLIVAGSIPFFPKQVLPVNPAAFVSLGTYFSIAVTVLFILVIPIAYSGMKYLMEPATHAMGLFLDSYKTGFRHWGFIFITIFLFSIANSFILLIISLPLAIVFTASVLSLSGTVNGDNVEIPGYFNAMTFVAATITCFIASFIFLYIIYMGYYIYGTIETRVKEKKEITKRNRQQ